MNELENIDDECDKLGIVFVKIDDKNEAEEYGIEKIPSLVYFEAGIPTMYEGNLEDEEKVLKWLEHQSKSDEIEDVNDEMLDLVIEKKQYVAVLFCKSPSVSRDLDPFKGVCLFFIEKYFFQMIKTRRRARRFWPSSKTLTTNATKTTLRL